MSNGEAEEIAQLELMSVVGYAGKVPNGLLVHQDRQHLIYALGDTVIIENLGDSSQVCLRGHTDNVTCIAVSNSGKYIASGQQTHMGFKADIIVWDYGNRCLYHTFTLHKVKVQALAFSPNDIFLVSLGGQDDGSVVLWNLQDKEAICGSAAAVPSAGITYALAFANDDDNLFFTAGEKTLRIWEVDIPNRKIKPTDCNLGQLKRNVNCIEVAEGDEYFFCGTTSGDILIVSVKNCLLKSFGPKKDKYSKGVQMIRYLKTGDLLIGCGDGTVALNAINADFSLKKLKSKKVEGEVTSIALRGNGHQFFVGTGLSNMYKFNLTEFSWELINTSHSSCIDDIAFPFGSSDLFATCSNNEIRIWNTKTSKELLRIEVPNMTCGAVSIMRNGKSIVSGWDDGKIRAFTPQSGKLQYQIEDAHSKGVTALATTSDNKKIVSGGGEGEVRVWELFGERTITYELAIALKEHKGAVTCIKVKSNDNECISASADGTCIIWDLSHEVRSQIVFANTMFKAVCYNPSECQVITAGTDRKIAYWETYDGSQIRELEGSKSGSIEGMDISVDGSYFVTGGADKLIKVWKYNEGEVTHVGIGHCGDVTRVKICPSSKYIISVSKDGGILRWKYPY